VYLPNHCKTLAGHQTGAQEIVFAFQHSLVKVSSFQNLQVNLEAHLLEHGCGHLGHPFVTSNAEGKELYHQWLTVLISNAVSIRILPAGLIQKLFRFVGIVLGVFLANGLCFLVKTHHRW
jgi:hypothetical protein